MINDLVLDLIQTSRANIQQHQPNSLEDVRNAPKLIAFSDVMQQQAAELKHFLLHNLYRHYQVLRMTSKARRIVTDLFNLLQTEPTLLAPDYVVSSLETDDKTKQARKIADYIAGMTDRYAMREHRRLFSLDAM